MTRGSVSQGYSLLLQDHISREERPFDLNLKVCLLVAVHIACEDPARKAQLSVAARKGLRADPLESLVAGGAIGVRVEGEQVILSPSALEKYMTSLLAPVSDSNCDKNEK